MSSGTAVVASWMLSPSLTRSPARFFFSDRATTHIKYLKMTQQQLQTRL